MSICVVYLIYQTKTNKTNIMKQTLTQSIIALTLFITIVSIAYYLTTTFLM